MTTTIIDPNAVEKIRAAIASGALKSGSWGNGTDAVCMMSAMVSGATSAEDCTTAGWPEWLAKLNVNLFDATVDAADEDAARAEFALSVAEAVQAPVDYDKARDLFLIRRLDTGDYSALKSLRLNPVNAGWWRVCETAIKDVVALLHRRISGEEVQAEMTAAHADADTAARAADTTAYVVARADDVLAYTDTTADAAARAAYADAYAAHAAAHAAAYAADAADTAARAADAADAADAAARAADAADDAAYAAAAYAAAYADATARAPRAVRASRAAARTDLITALKGAKA